MQQLSITTTLAAVTSLFSFLASVNTWYYKWWYQQDIIKKFEENTYEIDMNYDADDEDEWGQFAIIDLPPSN